MAHWLGALFCAGGALSLLSLVLPHVSVDSLIAIVAVAAFAFVIGGMLLAGVLDNRPPSAFSLVIAGANVLVSFGAYVSGNPTSGVELFYLWVTPYAYVLFSPMQAAAQTSVVAVCWGAVLLAIDRKTPSIGPPIRLAAHWTLTVLTVIAVGVLVRALSTSLRDADHRFRRAFADSGIGAAFLTTSFVWLEVNEALCEILGRGPEELIGRPDTEIASANDPDQPSPAFVVTENELIAIERRYRRPDGSEAWVAVTASLVVPESGESYVFAQYRDVTGHKQDTASLSHQAAHDPLTGLPNRTLLLERLESALERRREHLDCEVGVILLDLDQFKVVNDSLGHHVGDEVLTALAPVLARALEPGDTLARLGGDEFVVLCDCIAGPVEVLDRAATLARALGPSIELSTGRYAPSASFGVAVSTRPDDDAFLLLREADAAMYRAKANGRGRVELFNQAMREESEARMRLARQFHDAIGDGSLLLEYQPVVDLSTGTAVALEALVRWEHPELGRLAPDEFVPLSEDAGLSGELGEWVLETASRQFSRWRLPEAHSQLRLSVNISLAQLAEADFASRVADVLDRAGIDPGRFAIEIGESALLNSATTVRSLEALRARGVEVVLDGFDTGRSSLDHLERLPVGTVKTDRAVVARLGDRPRQDSVIEAIQAMASALGVVFVAGGVENEAQVERLRQLGCRYAQGHALAVPLPASEVLAYLARH